MIGGHVLGSTTLGGWGHVAARKSGNVEAWNRRFAFAAFIKAEIAK